MSEPRTEAGRRLVDKLNEIGRQPYSGISFPDIEDEVAEIEAEASSSDELRAALDVDVLATVVFKCLPAGDLMGGIESARFYAHNIAREYAALSSKPSAEPE